MTDLSQLDHDVDGRAGGAKKPPALEWVVTRKRGLHQVPSSQTSALIRAGGRLPTERDFAIAGVER